MKFKLNAIEVNQPIGNFYICKMDSQDVWRLAKADCIKIANDEDNLYKGVQRKLDSKKVDKIKRYLKSKDATFPNSIILNLRKECFLGYKDGILEILDNEEAFTIIDGQHRIEGLKESKPINFEIVLSVFIGLEIRDQSRLFVTINTEQTKVDPSLGLYQELNDNLYTPRKFVVKLAEIFSIDDKSPWKNMIKLIGKKDELSEEGILSLKAFVSPILDMIYDDEQHNDLRNIILDNTDNYEDIKKNFMWEFYENRNEDVLYKILFNYFLAMKELLSSDWGNKNSLLNKTTGYNAMMMLFKDVFHLGLKEKDLSYDFYMNCLKPISKLNGRINSSNFAPSGTAAAKELYNEFRDYIKI